MGLYERISEVAKDKGYSINRLEKELGWARSSINKFNKNKPSYAKLHEIADLLGVSIDYLTAESEEEAAGYYLNAETARIAQEMFEDKEIRSLFHMKRNMDPEKFQAHYEMMKKLYKMEHPEDDGIA